MVGTSVSCGSALQGWAWGALSCSRPDRAALGSPLAPGSSARCSAEAEDLALQRSLSAAVPGLWCFGTRPASCPGRWTAGVGEGCFCPPCPVKCCWLCSAHGCCASRLLNDGHGPLIIRIPFNVNAESGPTRCCAGASPTLQEGHAVSESLAPTAQHHPTGSPQDWEHPAVGRCCLAACPGVQGARTPQALSTGRDQRKGLLLAQAQRLSWGWVPLTLQGGVEGSPRCRGRGFSPAAGRPQQLAGQGEGSTEKQPFPCDVNGHRAAKPLTIPLPVGPSPLAAPNH